MAFRLHGPSSIVTRDNVVNLLDGISRSFVRGYHGDFSVEPVPWSIENFTSSSSIENKLISGDSSFSETHALLRQLPSRENAIRAYLDNGHNFVDCVNIYDSDNRRIATRVVNETAVRDLFSGQFLPPQKVSYYIASWRYNAGPNFWNDFIEYRDVQLRECQKRINAAIPNAVFGALVDLNQ